MATKKSNAEKLMKMAATLKATLSPSDIVQLIRLIEPTPSTGEMTSVQFERLLVELAPKNKRPGYSATSIKVARLVLVMGASVPEAAAEVAITTQGARQLMLRIRRRMASVPDGWKQVSVWLPGDVAAQVEKMSDALKSQDMAARRFSVSLVPL